MAVSILDHLRPGHLFESASLTTGSLGHGSHHSTRDTPHKHFLFYEWHNVHGWVVKISIRAGHCDLAMFMKNWSVHHPRGPAQGCREQPTVGNTFFPQLSREWNSTSSDDKLQYNADSRWVDGSIGETVHHEWHRCIKNRQSLCKEPCWLQSHKLPISFSSSSVLFISCSLDILEWAIKVPISRLVNHLITIYNRSNVTPRYG